MVTNHTHSIRVAPHSEANLIYLSSNNRTLGLSREMAQDLFTALSAVLFSGATEWPPRPSAEALPPVAQPKLKSTGDLLALLNRSPQ